jgi:hypothetical protein
VNNKKISGFREEVRIAIGDVCVSVNVSDVAIRNRLQEKYKDFLSRKKVNIQVYCKNIAFSEPQFDEVLYETSFYKVGKIGGNFVLFFLYLSSLLKFNKKLNRVIYYSQDQTGHYLINLLFLILFSLILPNNNAILLHASGVLNKNKGYLFAAPSGGGKSTISKLALKKKYTLLNDDRVFLYKDKISKKLKICGTPWHGEIPQFANNSGNIDKMFFLIKSKYNKIQPMNKGVALTQLYRNSCSFTVIADILKNKNNFYQVLLKEMDFYWLYFKPEQDLWRLIDEAR